MSNTYLGLSILTVGLVNTIGWLIFHTDILNLWQSTSMKFPSGLMFIFLGTALVLQKHWLKEYLKQAACIVALMSLLGFWSLDDPAPVNTVYPGIPSQVTAILVILNLTTDWYLTSVLTLSLAVSAVGGYIFDIPEAYFRTAASNGMSCQSALIFFVIGVTRFIKGSFYDNV